ncbi:putative permease [Polystyrenella longa]|uniref:Putative permease n=1 Tax=Polystyrenella longa TaxID=2528007 RepID=A0A518CT89_9PLAN|nr:permease [Polystyrenella longa]QDU82443.1 putative permease [Polystyrenella longa]
MLLMIISGFIVRFVQCLAQAAPFILTGLFVAAILQRMLGAAHTRALFGGNSRRSLIQAWGIGMLLPVCSLGVIPIASQMKRAGLAGGTILAFAMAAPLFNPLSLLYGLTLSEPVVIIAFTFCSLVLLTITGGLYDRFFSETKEKPEPEEMLEPGVKRILSIGISAARESVGPSLKYIAIGLVGVALLGAFLPHNSLQKSMNFDNPYAPLLMSALAVPVYATPMLAMSQLGMMFAHANSVGAAFVLLTLGAGLNLGLVYWMIRNFSLQKTLVWFALLLVIVLGIAYGVERPLFPADIDPANHSHAFDIYAQPFHLAPSNPIQAIKTKWGHDILPYEWYALSMLGVLMTCGLALRKVEQTHDVEVWLRVKSEREQGSKLDRQVSAPVLGMVAIGMLILFSIVGCFVYYPPKDEIFEEMQIARAEVLTAAMTGDAQHASYWIELLDDWSRKLEVSTYLREWELSDYRAMKSRLLREHLEMLEHAVEDEEKDEIETYRIKVNNAYSRMKQSYEDPLLLTSY